MYKIHISGTHTSISTLLFKVAYKEYRASCAIDKAEPLVFVLKETGYIVSYNGTKQIVGITIQELVIK